MPSIPAFDAAVPMGVSPADAAAFCRTRLAGAPWAWRVLPRLVPASDHSAMEALGCFFAWTDTLAPETTALVEPASDVHAWWENELEALGEGAPTHPVTIHLARSIAPERLDVEALRAFVRATAKLAGACRYATWDEMLHAEIERARPMVAVVIRALAVDADERTDDLIAAAALARVSVHLWNLREELLKHDRLPLPREFGWKDDFETRLRTSAVQRWGVDQRILEESRIVVRACVDRLSKRIEALETLPERTPPALRGLTWFGLHAAHLLLCRITAWDFEVALHRPTVPRLARMMLVHRARRAGRVRVS